MHVMRPSYPLGSERSGQRGGGDGSGCSAQAASVRKVINDMLPLGSAMCSILFIFIEVFNMDDC